MENAKIAESEFCPWQVYQSKFYEGRQGRVIPWVQGVAGKDIVGGPHKVMMTS